MAFRLAAQSGARDLYRIRVGDYRILYEILDRILTITIIRRTRRKDIYRGF